MFPVALTCGIGKVLWMFWQKWLEFCNIFNTKIEKIKHDAV